VIRRRNRASFSEIALPHADTDFPLHPVRTAQMNFRLARIAKIKDTAMLQESSHNCCLRLLPRFFTPGRNMPSFELLRENHVRSMERAGLIRFIDASAHFQFKLSGAAKTATYSYLLGVIRKLFEWTVSKDCLTPRQRHENSKVL